MAITYTYSFNCTIKYRFEGEDDAIETPKLGNNTALYTCSSEKGPAAIGEVDLPLPESLQGEDNSITWYLSKSYAETEKVTGTQSLKTTAWTLLNEVISGTFISYDAEIILYTNHAQKTINWVYTNSENVETTVTTTTWETIPTDSASEEYTRFISVYAPTIPSCVIKALEETSTLYTFTKWGEPSGTENTYTITAEYSSTTFNNTNPYTLKTENPFLKAEPYYYGTGTPSAGYYLPIGEDNDFTTSDDDDIKIQAPEKNGYSVIESLNQFKINGKALTYLQVGTFPLTRCIASTSTKGKHHLKISYNTDTEKITSIGFGKEGSTLTSYYNASSQNGVLYTDLKHGAEDAPQRLGFVLVGAGGGRGGGGRYDPDKNKKNSHGDFIIPGGGGGGGEIVYGVLDISYAAAKKLTNTTTPSELTYVITIGEGGFAGDHNISSGAESGGHDGSNGGTGGKSILTFKHSTGTTDIVEAYGGDPGQGAKNFTLGSGGDGGSGYNSRNTAKIASDYNCVVKAIKGGKGGDPTSTTAVANESLSFSIYFSNTVPPENDNYRISRSYASTSQTYSTEENTDASVFKTPGGHSFGQGAKSGTVGPEKGGGGGCFNNTYGTGANGFFGLYY